MSKTICKNILKRKIYLLEGQCQMKSFNHMHTPVSVKSQHDEESCGCSHHCHPKRMMTMNYSLYQIASFSVSQTCLHNSDLKLATVVFHLFQNCSNVKKLILLAPTPLSNILRLLHALLAIYFVDWAETQHKGYHLDYLLEEDVADVVGIESHN